METVKNICGIFFPYRQFLLLAVLVMSFVTFCAFGIDKYKAKKGKWRTPEKTLLTLTFLLGGIGGMLGMKVFHHKTKHLKFQILVPLFFILQLLTAAGLFTVWHIL